jgi:hypothetical protein
MADTARVATALPPNDPRAPAPPGARATVFFHFRTRANPLSDEAAYAVRLGDAAFAYAARMAEEEEDEDVDPLERSARRAASRRANESQEDYVVRVGTDAARAAARRADESQEDYIVRLGTDAARAAARRANESQVKTTDADGSGEDVTSVGIRYDAHTRE